MSSGITQAKTLDDLSRLYAPTKIDVYGQHFGPPEPVDPAKQPQQQGGMTQQQEMDLWRANMQNLPLNAGRSLDIWGGAPVDPKTGKPGEISPELYMQRLQQVYQNRPDLIWPGMNPNGTMQAGWTGEYR